MRHRNIIIALLLSVVLTFTACGDITTLPADIPVPSEDQTDSTQTSDSSDFSNFSVTFIDVGQGDSSLICCDGEYMLIDGGDVSASSTMYTYLKDREIDTLKVLVATHRDADHIGGLAGALNYAHAETAYCSTTSYTSKAFQNTVKYLEQGGAEFEVPNVGDTFNIGSATVTVLGPTKEYTDPNNNSIVLRVEYGDTTFLFTGDMEQTAEEDLLNSGADVKADVLKVGHHGSSTSTSYRFLREVEPTYAVISCGQYNSYGHPHEETLSKLRDADVTVYRTDLQGDITCRSDGKALTWETAKSATSEELNPTIADGSGQMSTGSSEETYIGNINSQTFHTPTCKNLPKESNRITFSSREEAVNAGYHPCGTCKP